MADQHANSSLKSADFQRRALRLIHGGVFLLLIAIVAEYYQALGWKLSLAAIVLTSLTMFNQYRHKMAKIQRFEDEQKELRSSKN